MIETSSSTDIGDKEPGYKKTVVLKQVLKIKEQWQQLESKHFLRRKKQPNKEYIIIHKSKMFKRKESITLRNLKWKKGQLKNKTWIAFNKTFYIIFKIILWNVGKLKTVKVHNGIFLICMKPVFLYKTGTILFHWRFSVKHTFLRQF